MNKVVLMGRLTRDPDIRHTMGENQTVVARYTLAVDRRFKRDGADGNADFISMVSFGRTAEFIDKYVHKGTKLVVSGRIQTGSYTNKDGVKVYTTDVVAEEVEFAESKKVADSYGGGSDYSDRGSDYSGRGGSYQGNDYSASEPQSSSGSSSDSSLEDGFMNVPDGIDEELPFA